MSFEGAVETTKFLRDRSKPFLTRVDLATSILNRGTDVVLPRRETVILEWIFDMLATDSSAKSCSNSWTLLAAAWEKAPETGKLRVLKNHKFSSNVSDAIKEAHNSPETISQVVSTVLQIAQSAQFLMYATDQQASQFLQAYLSNETARNNSQLGEFIFNSVKTRVRLFGKSDTAVLKLIFQEPDLQRRRHYLQDYLTTPSNAVALPEQANLDSLQMLVSALCETDVNVSDRVIELCKLQPHHVQAILLKLSNQKPKYLNPELLTQISQLVFEENNAKINWGAVDLVLEINAAPILDSPNYLSKLTTDPDTVPSSTTSLLLLKLAQLRKLAEFLPTWTPPTNISDNVREALTKAIDTISPLQTSKLLITLSTENKRVLELVLPVLSYETASSSAISKVLESLLADPAMNPSMRTSILELLPSASLNQKAKKLKHENAFLVLRAAELDPSLQEIVRKVVKYFNNESPESKECDLILLRHFPLLENSFKSSDDKHLIELVRKVSVPTRQQLASIPAATECKIISSAIINTSIKQGEVEVLHTAPKQIFDWDQRHKAVDVALDSQHFTAFKTNAEVVVKLLDTQNFPDADKLARFLSRAEPTNEHIELVLQILKLVQKNAQYIASIHDAVDQHWLQALVDAATAGTTKLSSVLAWLKLNANIPELLNAVLTILALLPHDRAETKHAARSLAVDIVQSSNPFPQKLFQILCHQSYEWPIITAFYVFTNSRQIDTAFAEYCRSLSKQQLDLLFYTAVEEAQYSVLLALTSNRLLDSENVSGNAQIVTAAIVKGGSVQQEMYWPFCDAVIRESPSLLSQFALESMLETIIKQDASIDTSLWAQQALIVSRLLLLKRRSLRNRLHLITASLTTLLRGIRTIKQASIFVRLIDNLCNPPQSTSRGGSSAKDSRELTSQIAKQRRVVAKHAGVLLQNMVTTILQNTFASSEWTTISSELRLAAFALVDLIYGNGLKAVSAGMDSANRAYLRSIFDDYKLHYRWSSD